MFTMSSIRPTIVLALTSSTGSAAFYVYGGCNQISGGAGQNTERTSPEHRQWLSRPNPSRYQIRPEVSEICVRFIVALNAVKYEPGHLVRYLDLRFR